MTDTVRAVFAAPVTAEHRPDDDGGPEYVARGLLLPFGETGRTSAGPMTADTGTALDWPEDPRRVKLYAGHNADAPIGVLDTVTADPAGVHAQFTVAGTTAGLEAYAELAAGVRDSFSIELADAVIDAGGYLKSGTVIGAALVARPAFPSAGAVAAEDTPETPETPETPLEGTAMEATAPAPDTTAALTPAAPAAAEVRAGARTAPVSAVQWMDERLRGEMFDGGPAGVSAALADITPAGNGAGNEMAALAVQFYGELWDGKTYQPIYTPCFREDPLTGAELQGWQWVTNPKVDDYAGNKAEIPTNPATLEASSVPAQRIAGGHDIDRIYIDFPRPGFWASYWREMTEKLAHRYDEKRIAHLDGVDTSPGTAPSLAEALALGVQDVPSATYAVIAADLWNAGAGTPVDALPASLSPGNPFYYGARLDLIMSPDLAAGTVIVGDQAANVFATIRPPVRMEAVNLSMGGVDAALFGYWAAQSNGGGVRKITVSGAAAAGSRGVKVKG